MDHREGAEFEQRWGDGWLLSRDYDPRSDVTLLPNRFLEALSEVLSCFSVGQKLSSVSVRPMRISFCRHYLVSFI